MKQILCFGDSNTWGLIPKTNQRYPWGVRWTSILDNELNRHFNNEYRVIEEGLCGRTTVFDDPLRDGRNSFKLLPTILESHNPVTDVIIMLGTNDCKTVYNASAEVIGQGVERLINQVRAAFHTAEYFLYHRYILEKVCGSRTTTLSSQKLLLKYLRSLQVYTAKLQKKNQ